MTTGFHRLFVALAIGGLVLANVAGTMAGSFDDPELSDPAGDVRYFPGTPPDGHEYIDIVAGFASHDRASDRVTLSLALADTTEMEEGIGDWQASCRLSMNLVRGDQNATLGLVFIKDGSAPVAFDAQLHKDGEFQTVDEEYGTSISFGQAGMANWSFAAGYLRSLGDTAQNFTAHCTAMMRAAGAPAIIVHSDDADGVKDYAIPGPPASREDPFDPADDLPDGQRSNRTGGQDGAGSESPGVPAVGVLLLVAACVAALAGRRRD